MCDIHSVDPEIKLKVHTEQLSLVPILVTYIKQSTIVVSEVDPHKKLSVAQFKVGISWDANL